MTNQFHVGQRVVCIDDMPNRSRRCPLVKGQVYTVSAVRLSAMNNIVIEADEVEGGWYASRFRPVVERKTSIEIFQAMLNKPTVRIDA